MKIAVFIPNGCPLSMRIYANSIMSRLEKTGMEFIVFKRNEAIPEDVDLFWDPRSGGGQNPYRYLKRIRKPLVVTVHGLALFSMQLSELYDKGKARSSARKNKWKYRLGWFLMRKRVSKIITVSRYSKTEVIQYLSFKDKDVIPIHNGYDKSLFNQDEEHDEKQEPVNGGKPYFLTVISYQKKKNFERMLEAYDRIPASENKPDFICLVKPYNKQPAIDGVKIINDKLDIQEIIRYYRNAKALIFPTLHEGFGLPIIEAMACGCPVVTSNITGAAEVAGDAAIQVNPRSVDEIMQAMKDIMDESVREALYPKMKERLTHFGWDQCAMQHKEVFEGLINGGA